MFKLFRKISLASSQWLCSHKWIRKIDRDEAHAYLECINCLKRTPGISLYGPVPKPPYEHRFRK